MHCCQKLWLHLPLDSPSDSERQPAPAMQLHQWRCGSLHDLQKMADDNKNCVIIHIIIETQHTFVASHFSDTKKLHLEKLWHVKLVLSFVFPQNGVLVLCVNFHKLIVIAYSWEKPHVLCQVPNNAVLFRKARPQCIHLFSVLDGQQRLKLTQSSRTRLIRVLREYEHGTNTIL